MSRDLEEEVVAENDRLLERLVHADPGAADAEIARLIGEVARPLVHKILSSYERSFEVTSRQTREDVEASVVLRLFEKLRRVRASPDEVIRDFRDTWPA